MMNRELSWTGPMRATFIAVIVAFLALMVMDFNSRTADLNRLTAERVVVNARLESKEGAVAAWNQKLEYAASDAAAAEWAYQNHWVQPEDNLVIPFQQFESTPVPEPIPEAPKVETPYWKRWLSLFLETETP